VITFRLHMRTSKRFVPSFGLLAGISRLTLGVALGVIPSCALDEGSMTDDPTVTDDSTAQDGTDASNDSVCTTGTYRCHARIRTSKAGLRISAHAAAPLAGSFGPADLQAAYNIDPSVTATAKPTVAIVDAYGYAAIESDLAVYRRQYGLPECSIANGCLKVVNQLGQTSPLPPKRSRCRGSIVKGPKANKWSSRKWSPAIRIPSEILPPVRRTLGRGSPYCSRALWVRRAQVPACAVLDRPRSGVVV